MNPINEINDISYATDSAIDDIATLTRLKDISDGKQLSTESIEISMIAIESIYDRLGIEYVKREAIEDMDISGKIQTVWIAIKKAFAKMWEMVLNFIDGYLTGLEGIKRYNERVKEKVKNFKGDLSTVSFKDNLLAVAFFSVRFSLHNPVDNCIAILHNHIDVTKSVMMGLTVIETLLNKMSKPGLFNKDMIRLAADQYYSKLTMSVRKKVDGDKPIIMINALELDLYRENDYNFFMFDIASRTGAVHKADMRYSEYVKPLNIHNIAKVSEQIDDLLDLADEYKKNVSKYKKLNKEFNSIIDNMLSYIKNNANKYNAVDDTDSKVDDDVIEVDTHQSATSTHVTEMDARSMEYTFKTLKNVVYKTITVLPSINLQACRYAIRYIDKSLDNVVIQ